MSEDRKAIEAWAKEKEPLAWLYAAAKALRGWAIGQEVTEEDFDDAISDAAGVRLGVSTKG